MTPTIRPETPADREAVRRVHRLAFGQGDEGVLVDSLRTEGYARVSLVAEAEGRVVGHILFSEVPILTDGGTIPALSLAPVAVLPDCQRMGIGSALVRQGLEVCRTAGHRIVVVLGHPNFYPRFGFRASLAGPLSSAFGGGEAWMAQELVPGVLTGVSGWVRYPPPFGAGVQVRPVFRPDRDEWVRMRTALWPDDSGEHGDELDGFFATGTFRGLEAERPWRVLVAERPNGGLCGFVEASIRPFVEDCSTMPVGYIEGWYVDPDSRRQGVGRKLMKAAEDWATSLGCEEVASDAKPENAVSRQAHKAVGFEEAGHLVHFHKRVESSPGGAAIGLIGPPRLTLVAVSGTFAVCRLSHDSPLPAWAVMGELFSVTRTADELSVVCRQEAVPEGVKCERGWRCLRVAGSMPFTLVGVLASLTGPLARAGVSVFAVSTFDTDYLLVKEADLTRSVAVLRAAGHQVQ